MDKKVWFITGASKGLGLALIKKLLGAGHRVAAASKFLPALVEAVSKTPDAGFLPLEFDPADKNAVAASIRSTRETFGHIDTVAINAGYTAADPRETTTIIRSFLPWLRNQGSGHIINIGLPELPVPYIPCPGVHLTTVIRSTFQTRIPAGPHPVHTMTFPIDGKQIADPQRAASALLEMAALSIPPARLFLASNAGNLATTKMAQLERTINDWETMVATPSRQ